MFKKMFKRISFLAILVLITAGCAAPAAEKVKDTSIIDEWKSVATPPAPELKPVSVNPKSTALLILDIQNNSCSQEQRPRCAASIPKIIQLLDRARETGMPVVYSITTSASPSDIVTQLAPGKEDLVVKSSVDKFYKTDLGKILQDKGVKTVVIVGTAAHGAVLHTATAASVRGFQVIFPVDSIKADTPYAEQYTTWHMLNSPGTRNRVTLTKAKF